MAAGVHSVDEGQRVLPEGAAEEAATRGGACACAGPAVRVDSKHAARLGLVLNVSKHAAR
eukprot:CAMPEP_0202843636 /NCGR_PEP_ID=MMETSP1389-20130828/64929_1 /ASSEMBLY_ACC=CAM_ASM_000865 /TAXON_ID=302021 /ORGANISM="Rhodomonas sp., Strain CCMP768" /LENGTH=59 /DNA_ID=CAMNT_0049520797 /DNA_START=300 /DNA_END=477 /DNA_ORIENTATION=-